MQDFMPILAHLDHLEEKRRMQETFDLDYALQLQTMDVEDDSSSSDSDTDNEVKNDSKSDTKGDTVTIKEASDCCVCLSVKSTHAVVPCMHVCLCEACANKMKGKNVGKKCPLCKRKCTSINKLWF